MMYGDVQGFCREQESKRKDAIKYCKKIMKCEILTNEKGEALYWRDFVEGEEEDFESLIGM